MKTVCVHHIFASDYRMVRNGQIGIEDTSGPCSPCTKLCPVPIPGELLWEAVEVALAVVIGTATAAPPLGLRFEISWEAVEVALAVVIGTATAAPPLGPPYASSVVKSMPSSADDGFPRKAMTGPFYKQMDWIGSLPSLPLPYFSYVHVVVPASVWTIMRLQSTSLLVCPPGVCLSAHLSYQQVP